MDTLIPVNVVVGDRTYRVKIEPSNEEAVRKTVKIINDKIIELKTAFAGKDMQDYIAMVILWYATQGQEAGNSQTMSVSVSDKMNLIETLLDKALQK
jgi:cell division protein ZapA (FtsZ GTPase activity inhibitor)